MMQKNTDDFLNVQVIFFSKYVYSSIIKEIFSMFFLVIF